MKTTDLIPNYVYDVTNFDLEEARQNTLKFDGHRFRILFEIAKGCFGNCEGCSLSSLDRRSAIPAMSLEQVQDAFDYFRPLIQSNKKLVTTVVNYGTGDYFMMDEDFLEELFKKTHEFFEQLPTIRNVLTISTSLFLPEEKMESRLHIMTKYLQAGQFAIDGVVDPFKLAIHYDRYLANYKAITKHLPFFDCVFNFADGLTQEHADYVIRFIKDAKLLNFDFQYAINNTNTYRVKIHQDKFNEFFEYLYSKVPSDLLDMSIAQPTATNEDDIPIFVHMEKNAKEIVTERLTIDAKGDIYPIAFGYGDIILDHRYNFKPIGNIKEPFDPEKGQKMIVDYLKNLFVKNKICHTCEYNTKCYSTGYAFYNTFNDNPNKCDNVGLFFFKKNNESDA